MIWEIVGKIVGILSIVLAVLSIMPAMMSGAALGVVLFILIVSGITALSGHIQYALVGLAITTINLIWSYLVSPPIPGWGRGQSLEMSSGILLLFGIPYAITILLIIIGHNIKIKRDAKSSKIIKNPYFIFVVVYFIFFMLMALSPSPEPNKEIVEMPPELLELIGDPEPTPKNEITLPP